MDNFLAHILVVDDDEGIRSLVKKYLNEKKVMAGAWISLLLHGIRGGTKSKGKL